MELLETRVIDTSMMHEIKNSGEMLLNRHYYLREISIDLHNQERMHSQSKKRNS